LHEPALEPPTDPDILQTTIDNLNDLAWDLRDMDPAHAQSLAEKSMTLATNSAWNGKPYYRGLIVAARNLGYLHNLSGEYQTSFSRSLNALSLPEKSITTTLKIAILRNMGYAVFSLGKFADGLEYEYQALKLAREIGEPGLEAFTLDAIGTLYNMANNTHPALETLQEALRIYHTLSDKSGETIVLNNLAMIHLQNEELDLALDASLKSLKLAHANQFTHLEEFIYGTLGEIYLAMKDFDQASHYLDLFRIYTQEHSNKLNELWALILLGKLYIDKMEDAIALQYIQEALKKAQSSGFLLEKAECQQLLAKVYEHQGKYQESLYCFKQFYAMKESLYNQEIIQKIVNLQTFYKIEEARKETAILHQQSIELQKEIEEHKQAQAAFEELATVDPLTGLLNRRKFFMLAENAIKEIKANHSSLSIVMIDIDHFKTFNDSYGHLVGDAILSILGEILKKDIRKADIAARFGGDEFVILLPNTELKQAQLLSNRLCERIAAKGFPSKSNQFFITASLGISFITCDHECSLEQLLEWADHALYSAKQSGRNCVQVYQPLNGKT
jgi:diguanylate cyclase